MPDRMVPDSWWRATCEKVSLPLACVGKDNTFIWVNSSFERLVGYSIAELVKIKWSDITLQEDIGGDLQSVAAVIEGKIPQYTLSKHYVHKFGHEVPVQLTVWRFPANAVEPMACFIVEASPEVVTYEELAKIQKRTDHLIEQLTERLHSLENRQREDRDQITVHVGDNAGNDHVGGHKAGRDVGGFPWLPTLLAVAIVVLLIIAIMRGV